MCLKRILNAATIMFLSIIFVIQCNCITLSVYDIENTTATEYIATDAAIDVDAELITYAKSVLLMEKSTGRILYSLNENEKLYPASVTKIMSILLVCESLASGKIKLDDKIICSENAASKGGSQIWLEAGETMTVEELLKATCIYSANDACTLLGEHIAGSETAFNVMMNKRAAELGMTNTNFDNCTGLDDTSDTHLTTAYDIALMARELLKYDFIKEYTTIWMDSLRNGETQLVNTNKLIRYYNGITGLKTGTTEKAGCCVCATAERDGMELIAVVMGSENSNDRFKSAQNLLDWGFANFAITKPEAELPQDKIQVQLGECDFVGIEIPEIAPVLVNKQSSSAIECEISIPEFIAAPVNKGSAVGKISVMLDGENIAEYTITAKESISKMSFFNAFGKLLTSFSIK